MSQQEQDAVCKVSGKAVAASPAIAARRAILLDGLSEVGAALLKAPHVVEGVIFDCDGTLLDSLGAWRELENAVCRASGGACRVTDADRQVMIACTVPETARYLHERMGFLGSNQEAEDFMDRFLIEHYSSQATLYPGASELVELLSRAEVPLAVASSSRPAYLEAGLQGAGIRGFFQHVVSVDDMGMSKRDPSFYQAVGEMLGTPRLGTWVFEDALYAARTAMEAGFPTVGLVEGENRGQASEFECAVTLPVGHVKDLLAHA